MTSTATELRFFRGLLYALPLGLCAWLLIALVGRGIWSVAG